MADGAEKVLELKVVDDKAEINAQAVQYAEELLEGAKSGKIQSLLAVAFHSNGRYTAYSTGQLGLLEKVGALRQIEFDIFLDREGLLDSTRR